MKDGTNNTHQHQKHVKSPVRRLPCVWDPSYHSEAATWLSTRKQRDVVAMADKAGLIEVISAAPFHEEWTSNFLKSIHHPAYVEAVRTGTPRNLAESQGFKWSPEFAKSVVHIFEGHIKACRLALTAGLVMHPVSGAHHADYFAGGGFCTFNFLVGAGRALLDAGLIRRVAVIDLDAHQGDGTFDMVCSNPSFALFDIAEAQWIRETAFGPRACIHVSRDAHDYMRFLHQKLPRFLDLHRPDLVQYQAGMDPHEDDPVGGITGISWSMLADRDEFVIREVRKRGIPLVVNLAGGYRQDGSTVRGHVETFRRAQKLASRKQH